MRSKSEVLSVKVPPVTKKMVLEGAAFSNLTQGEYVSEAIKQMLLSSGYDDFLNDILKKNGFVLSDILHSAVKVESTALFGNLSVLICDFWNEYQLALDEQFEDVLPEEVNVDTLEEFGFISEWESFLAKEISNAALSRIEAEINEFLSINHASKISQVPQISSELLLEIFPRAKRNLSIEVESQIRLFNGSYELSMVYYLEVLAKKYKKTNFKIDHLYIFDLLQSLEKKNKYNERLWFYVLSVLISDKYRRKIPSQEEVNEFFDKIFTEKEFTVFKIVNPEDIINEIKI